jgi:hypothetical protein
VLKDGKPPMRQDLEKFHFYLFRQIVVVVLLKFALNFAVAKQKIHELEANFDWIDNRRDWVENIPINLKVDNILHALQIAFLNHLYLIPLRSL